MTTEEKALHLFGEWYAALKIHKASGGPAKGSIAVALVLLDRLKEKYTLSLDHHRAKGKSQIKGAGGSALKKILARFGEHRPFASEGGRTNRGGPGEIENMLRALEAAGLDRLPGKERNKILTKMQAMLVEKVRGYHQRQHLRVAYDPSKTKWQLIHDLLAFARQSGKDGAVAQYLVGAKLQLRFPDEAVENKSFSTADQQLGRQGDYQVRDTSFHITVAPTQAHFEKCLKNIEAGLRVYLLVPDGRLVGARQNADQVASGKITVESVESFVAQNVDELSVFSAAKESFRDLLETYNKRVDEVENDKSLLFDIPPGLK